MKSQFGLLRKIEASDLEMILEWRNVPEVRMNMYTQHVISREEHQQWWQKTSLDEKQAYFIFENKGIPAGVVSFNQIDKDNLQSFWAFYASPDAPRGTGMKMELLALDFAFESLGLHKLSCEVLAFNVKVINLHLKFGFQKEGVFRENYLLDGEYIDVYRLGILSSEWKEKRPEMVERIARFSGK